MGPEIYDLANAIGRLAIAFEKSNELTEKLVGLTERNVKLLESMQPCEMPDETRI